MRQRNLMGVGFSAGQAGALCHGGAAVVSAGTGSIAAATALPYGSNALSAAASLDAYLLPSTAQNSALGDTIKCFTTSSTSAVVYAGTGETINNAATFTVAQYKQAIFTRYTSTQWGATVTP